MVKRKADNPEREALLAAPYASLTNRAVTDEAHSFVGAVTSMLREAEMAGGERKYHRRTTEAKFRRAVEGFLGDLLSAQNDSKAAGWTGHATRAQSFTGKAVSHRVFTAVYTGMLAQGLLQHTPGFQTTTDWGDGSEPTRGGKRFAPRFRATPKLIALASQRSVSVEQAGRHFIESLPADPLTLRATSTRNGYGQKVRGKLLGIDRNRKTERLRDDIAELNEFFDQYKLRHCPHRGFVRIFNNGDDPAFRWNMGGRLYSLRNDSFQQMDEDNRLKMTIAGEAVCEIDIKASWLTVFHAWHDQQLDFAVDPYDRLGFGHGARAVVKNWFTATWGSGAHIQKWPREMVKEYAARTGKKLGRDFPVRMIKDRAITTYPILLKWGDDKLAWAHMMYEESKAIVTTMLRLMREHTTPSLSVHDSIIVPKSKRSIAEELLATEYEKATGAQPHLVTSG